MRKKDSYTIEPFLDSRLGTVDIGIASRSKHYMQALIELDVTEARSMMRDEGLKGHKVSFNSWIIKCISMAIEENKTIQGIRKGRHKIIVYDDIDISVMVEREVDGNKIPFPYLIRETNHKSIEEITDEINLVKQAQTNTKSFVLGEKKQNRFAKLYALAPGFIRKYIWRRILSSPSTTKKTMGTVMITSLGMIGKINGWILPKSVHPLAFAIGSIVKKPGVIHSNIEVREYLYITISVDHDVIDGAPAVRILSKLTKFIESGYGIKSDN